MSHRQDEAPSSAHRAAAGRTWVRSLRFRLTASFVVIIGLILAVTLALGFVAARHDLVSDTDTFLQLEADRYVEADLTTLFSGQQNHGPQPQPQEIGITYLRAVDAATHLTVAKSANLSKSRRLVRSLDAIVRRLPAAPPATGVQPFETFGFVGEDKTRKVRVLTRYVNLLGHSLYVQAATPWTHSEDLLARSSALMAAGIVAVLAAVGLGGWTLVGRTLAPFGRIVTEVNRLDPADLPESLLPQPPETDSEIGSLVHTLNRMVTRLRQAFQSQARFAEAQQRFAADASHELRTPLTIMRGEIDLALSRSRTSESYRKTLESAQEEIDHMVRIVEGLSTLARHDAGTIAPSESLEAVEVKAVAADLMYGFNGIAAEKGVSLSLTCGDAPEYVAGNAAQIERLLRNLIENAIKYTPAGGSVTVSIGHRDDTVRVTVSDTGIGISSEDIPHVFERFWRADRARTTAGTGLGLSICDAIVRAHSGRIHILSEPGVGSVFTVDLPAKP